MARGFLIFLLFLSGGLANAADINPRVLEAFESQVRPILVRHCYECHGPETEDGEGQLRLDSLKGILKGGQSGPAIKPGKPFESLLLHAVNHEPSVVAMPPKKRISNAEIATMTRWVRIKGRWPEGLPDVKARPQGSPRKITDEDRRYWAFVAPELSDVPTVKKREWTRNAVDHFVLANLEVLGIDPVNAADKRTLIRRVTFDLHGLPPTIQDVERFLEDKSPDAFRKLVDRLLDSPRYGRSGGVTG